MNSQIIELSNSKADSIISNGDFVTSFAPIVINNGDTIQIKSACINTITQTTNDQIFIEEDINLGFKFIIYEIDHDLNSLQQRKKYFTVEGSDEPRYSPFVLCDYGATRPLEFSQTRILPKGIYTAASLAQEITRLMSNFPSNNNNTINPNLKMADIFNPYTTTKNNFYFSLSSLGIQRPEGNDYYNCSFCQLQDNFGTINYLNRYLYTANSSDQYDSDILVGADNTGLSWNNTPGNSHFQFDQIHTSIKTSNYEPCVVFRKINNSLLGNIFAILRLDSGIIFTDLQPANFWSETLGFNLDNLLCKLPPEGSIRQNLTMNFSLCTTRGLFTIADINQQPYRNVNWNTQTLNFTHVTEDTEPIKAHRFQKFDLSPYYFIELSGNFNNSSFKDGKTLKNSIFSITTKGYIINNFVISYDNDSIQYVHQGEPLILSNIRCRILNALDKTKVETNIDTNNFIMLEIIKNNLPINQESNEQSAKN